MTALYKPAVRTMAACSFAAAAMLAAAGTARAQTAAPSSPAAPPATANAPAPGGSGTIAGPRHPTSTEVNAAFDRADENHDARLTRAEADRFPEVARRFEQIDTNRDTFISREEFNKAVTGTS